MLTGRPGIVEAKKILYYKTDASGVVRAIVMRNATGNAFIYGLVSATEDDDGENRSYSVTTDTTAGSGVVTVSTVTAQGGVSLPVQGPYGGLAVGGGYARAFNKLEKQGQVTLDAFDAASNVHVDGRSLPSRTRCRSTTSPPRSLSRCSRPRRTSTGLTSTRM